MQRTALRDAADAERLASQMRHRLHSVAAVFIRRTSCGERAMPQHPIGQIVIQRIVESICTAFEPLSFFPETTPHDWARHRTWMEPRALDPVSGNLVLPIQAFLVRTRRHTILIDTCVGHNKSRSQRLFWHMKKFDTFLPRLAAAGVRPEDVDYVMCAHLHSDHVGWNTQLRDGRWVPTFPNAKYRSV